MKYTIDSTVTASDDAVDHHSLSWDYVRKQTMTFKVHFFFYYVSIIARFRKYSTSSSSSRVYFRSRQNRVLVTSSNVTQKRHTLHSVKLSRSQIKLKLLKLIGIRAILKASDDLKSAEIYISLNHVFLADTIHRNTSHGNAFIMPDRRISNMFVMKSHVRLTILFADTVYADLLLNCKFRRTIARHVRGMWRTYISKLLVSLEKSISPMKKSLFSRSLYVRSVYRRACAFKFFILLL